jgi:6-phospho-3-hexuloisomerase
MSFIKKEKKILQEICSVLEKNSEKSEKNLVKEILSAKIIFVAGAGRSGLMAKSFAMRLMQLGLKAFVVGETTTPSITKKDLLVIVSGSGETQTILDILKESPSKKACITAEQNSPIAKESELIIILKGKTKEKGKSIEPLGSLFEQSALIFLDTVILGLMEKLKTKEKKMKQKHANTE